MLKSLLKILYDLAESFAFAGAIFVVCYLFLFQVSEVHGASSYPTLQENEKLILDKVSYRFSDPKRGDFVIINSPTDRNVEFVKRIIGLPNEILKINNCSVFINGYKLEEEYLKNDSCTSGNLEIKIPEKYYFVMGDNRIGSSDSRSFGPVSHNEIVGKVILRIYPLEKFGSLY